MSIASMEFHKVTRVNVDNRTSGTMAGGYTTIHVVNQKGEQMELVLFYDKPMTVTFGDMLDE